MGLAHHALRLARNYIDASCFQVQCLSYIYLSLLPLADTDVHHVGNNEIMV